MKPFNPYYCPGLGPEVSRKYALLCDNVPGLTRGLRKRVHRLFHDLLEDEYPPIGWKGTIFGRDPEDKR